MYLRKKLILILVTCIILSLLLFGCETEDIIEKLKYMDLKY